MSDQNKQTNVKSNRRKSTIKPRMVIVIVISLFFALTAVASAQFAYRVDIIDNSTMTVRSIITMKDDSAALLAQSGFEIGENDYVDYSGFVQGTNSKIVIHRAFGVTLVDNGEERVVYAVKDIEQTLELNNIKLYGNDYINYDLDYPVFEYMNIIISRAFDLSIDADGEEVVVNVATGLVKDVIEKAGIVIEENDLVTPDLNELVTKDTKIKIQSVDIKQRTEKTVIKHETVTKLDPKMSVGKTKIAQSGNDGEKQTTYKEYYIKGKLAKTEVYREEITKVASEEIKIIGSKPVVTQKYTEYAGTASVSNLSVKRTGIPASSVKAISSLTVPSDLMLDENGVPLNYKKKLVGTSSAYSTGELVATGKRVRTGYIAVDPKIIPYGTKMWIVSNDGAYVYGYSSAEDTGGFVKWTGNRATISDLFMNSEEETRIFGRRDVTIYIL